MSAVETHTPESLLARIRRDGVRRTAQALRKPPLPSPLLQALADLPADEAPEARLFVAAYPLAPSHLLETLAARHPEPALLALLATNPRTPPHLLVDLAAYPVAEVRAQAAQHPQLPARELLALAEDTEPAVRRSLATNSALRLPQQARLAADAEPSVRAALAGQSALAAPAALVLAIDDSAVVRLHTVASAPVDDETLIGWAATDEEDVQLALFRRRQLPEAAERLLLQSSHASVRRVAREKFEPDEIDLLHFITAGDTEERRWVAARPRLPRPLQRLLAQDQEGSVRGALAANPDLHPDIAAYFVDLADEAACLALAGNASVSEDLIQGVAATRRPAVLAALAYRPTLDPEIAALLVARSPVFRRHWATQDRPISGLDAETARTLVADRLPGVRALGVAGHDWRRADLYDFYRDPVPRVRLAAVRHANAPDELLADALSDPAEEVAAAAREIQAARAAARDVEKTPPPASAPAPLDSPEEPTFPPASLPSRSEPLAPVPRRETSLLGKLKRLFR
jgi:Leucine rich repeat variant.